eukprot:tig00020825_g14288.t1
MAASRFNGSRRPQRTLASAAWRAARPGPSPLRAARVLASAEQSDSSADSERKEDASAAFDPATFDDDAGAAPAVPAPAPPQFEPRVIPDTTDPFELVHFVNEKQREFNRALPESLPTSLPDELRIPPQVADASDLLDSEIDELGELAEELRAARAYARFSAMQAEQLDAVLRWSQASGQSFAAEARNSSPRPPYLTKPNLRTTVPPPAQVTLEDLGELRGQLEELEEELRGRAEATAKQLRTLASRVSQGWAGAELGAAAAVLERPLPPDPRDVEEDRVPGFVFEIGSQRCTLHPWTRMTPEDIARSDSFLLCVPARPPPRTPPPAASAALFFSLKAPVFLFGSEEAVDAALLAGQSWTSGGVPWTLCTLALYVAWLPTSLLYALFSTPWEGWETRRRSLTGYREIEENVTRAPSPPPPPVPPVPPLTPPPRRLAAEGPSAFPMKPLSTCAPAPPPRPRPDPTL